MIRVIQKRLHRSWRRNQTGQAILILAVGFIALAGFVGLVTDVSILFVRYAALRRAVDSAAIAAAGQFRQDREIVAIELAARQFLEFHNVDAGRVLVETCFSVDPDWATEIDQDLKDLYDEVCTADQRKLVRVTAEMDSPTVFLGLLGFTNFTLQASSISETAVLDVVVILDVSESMMNDTSFQTWEDHLISDPNKQFVRYMPPRVEDQYTAYIAWITANNRPNFLASRTDFYYRLLEVATESTIYSSNYAFNDGLGNTVPLNFAPTTYYLSGSTPTIVANPASNANLVPIRSDCQMRMHPILQTIDDPTLKAEWRTLSGATSGYNVNTAPFNTENFSLFQSTYDFYGCCNDPAAQSATVKVDADGNIANGAGEIDFTARDWDFSDLVCQPFKGAKDATRKFLDRVDFLRGDRVAFVTFDRSAYLVDPDGAVFRGGGDRSHMIEVREDAVATLNQLIGVRSEPSFYYTAPRGDLNSDGDFSDIVGGVQEENPESIDLWNNYAEGSAFHVSFVAGDVNGDGRTDTDEGVSVGRELPSTYNTQSVGNYTGPYLVRGSCPFSNASFRSSLWLKSYNLVMIDMMTPDVTVTGSPWRNYYTNEFGAGSDWGRLSYENIASCRGTNIGSGLRVANNALLDPATTRREGAVWVIIMLSDGAANGTERIDVDPNTGATDPSPYNPAPSAYNPQPGQAGFVAGAGRRGDYGALGFCPHGTVGGNPYDSPGAQGYADPDRDNVLCNDTKPYERNYCNTDRDGDGIKTELELDGVLIQTLASPGTFSYAGNACRELYNADDYARDWADYVAMERGSDSLNILPSIFTIGYGLTFDDTTGSDICQDNLEDCLGEELLKYIADVGDNNRYDDDYPKIVELDTNSNVVLRPANIETTYGNYFNAPDDSGLDQVFDEIASRMFTRIFR
ncbi:MAG: TadE/TadG family type IV pilus assembly protein [Phototrophicaceae bacterium]